MVLAIGFLLLVIKFIAYYLTRSTAILSDALESIINVAANGFALFSVYFASLPRDENHPYGHGKIEFLSAGFEGGLIFVAGIFIIYKAIYHFLFPQEIEELGTGIWLTASAGLVNFVMGNFLVRQGKQQNSITLIADGKHLISDTYSSIGLIAGLLIIYFTKIIWIDSLLAIFFAIVIMITGTKLLRKSFAGLMDEADKEILEQIIFILRKNKKANWIDIHNLRLQKYGSLLHIDCHLTLPWYENLKISHNEIKEVERLVNKNMGNRVEFSIHADPCVPTSCSICEVKLCSERKHHFQQSIPWTVENLVKNKMHQISKN